jgi:hypothetical protein
VPRPTASTGDGDCFWEIRKGRPSAPTPRFVAVRSRAVLGRVRAAAFAWRRGVLGQQLWAVVPWRVHRLGQERNIGAGGLDGKLKKSELVRPCRCAPPRALACHQSP